MSDVSWTGSYASTASFRPSGERRADPNGADSPTDPASFPLRSNQRSREEGANLGDVMRTPLSEAEKSERLCQLLRPTLWTAGTGSPWTSSRDRSKRCPGRPGPGRPEGRPGPGLPGPRVVTGRSDARG